MKYSFDDVLEQTITTEDTVTISGDTVTGELSPIRPQREEFQKTPILEQVLDSSEPKQLYSSKTKQKSKLIVEGEKYFLLSENGRKQELTKDQVQTLHDKIRAKFEEEEKLRLLRNRKAMYYKSKKNMADLKEARDRELLEEKAKEEKSICPICHDPGCSFW